MKDSLSSVESSPCVQSLLSKFNNFYSNNSEELYKISPCSILPTFIQENADLIEEIPFCTSLELIDWIIQSDPFLKKVNLIVEWSKSTFDIDRQQYTEFIDDISSRDFQDPMSGQNLSSSEVKKLYELMYGTLKSSGLKECSEILQECNLDFVKSVLNEGTPFFSFQNFKATNRNQQYPFQRNNVFPDFVNSGNLYPHKSGWFGNHQWLIYLRNVNLMAQSVTNPHEKKLFAFIASNSDIISQLDCENFGDEILNMTRVSIKNIPIF